MKTYIQQIKLNLSLGEMDQALLLLGELAKLKPRLHSKWVLISGRYNKNEKDFALGILSRNEYDLENNQVRYAIGHFINQNILEWKGISLPKQVESLNKKGDLGQKDVFISYSHWNTEIAMKMKDRLEADGIKIQIDDYEMYPGIDVYNYIRDAVKNTKYTLSIISSKSLLSTWVAMESLKTFEHENYHNNHRFIPCYIDKSFMDRRFTLDAIKHIDKELSALDNIITEQNTLKVDTRNLNEEKSRLHQLRSSIDEIIGRLKKTKCMNINEPFFEENLKKIINKIRN